jgi:hypothetical protein
MILKGSPNTREVNLPQVAWILDGLVGSRRKMQTIV